MKIKVSGNIANEISSNIPTYFVAINELLKNSYDADASEVTITLNEETSILTIEDNGTGMSKEGIQNLLHVSKSNKKYAQLKQNGRYVQGSKGLGFLAAFKFGHKVTWTTKTSNNDAKTFTINLDDLINLEEISKYEINITDSNMDYTGTTVEIELDQNKSKKDFIFEYFKIQKNQEKIIHAFESNFMDINLIINDKKIPKTNVNIKDCIKDRQRFYIEFNSKLSNKVYFLHNGQVVIEDEFDIPKEFNVQVKLAFFNFSKGSKNDLPGIFRNEDNELTPIIYVNQNIFHNEKIFYPNIMQTIRYSDIMNQVSGQISIYSNDSNLEFNSDRTNFVENNTTIYIQQYIRDLNIFLQKKVAQASKFLVDLDFLKKNKIIIESNSLIKDTAFNNINDDFYFKNAIDIKVNQNQIVYSIFNKHTTCEFEVNKNNIKLKQNNEKSSKKSSKNNSHKILKEAKILLKKNEDTITIPSEQINLHNYIKSASDSNGNLVDYNNIEIFKNSKPSNRFLSSIVNEETITIDFKYNDSNTGLVQKSLKLNFKIPKAPIIGNDSTKLLYLPTKSKYELNFNQYINRLINQINSIKDISEYSELIACSLRSLFEISCDSINKIDEDIFKNKNNTAERVEVLVEKVASDDKFKSQISKNSQIDYRSLKNIFNKDSPNKFKEIISKANLGAHKSTMYIENETIEDLAKYASQFLLLTNEYIVLLMDNRQ